MRSRISWSTAARTLISQNSPYSITPSASLSVTRCWVPGAEVPVSSLVADAAICRQAVGLCGGCSHLLPRLLQRLDLRLCPPQILAPLCIARVELHQPFANGQALLIQAQGLGLLPLRLPHQPYLLVTDGEIALPLAVAGVALRQGLSMNWLHVLGGVPITGISRSKGQKDL